MTSGAVLIFGSTIKNREQVVYNIIKSIDHKLVEKENPDLQVIKTEKGKSSISIAQVRKAISFISTKPYSSKSKVVVIYNAQDLTAQAQNALLKTLEEPPAYALILLCTKTENALLPTILSRCRKIKASTTFEEDTATNEDLKHSPVLQKIIAMDIGERFELAQELSKIEKEDLVEVMENLIIQMRELLIQQPDMKSVKNIKKALQIKKDLEETNVNTRLALETVFISL